MIIDQNSDLLEEKISPIMPDFTSCKPEFNALFTN